MSEGRKASAMANTTAKVATTTAAAFERFPEVRDPAMPERQGRYDPSYEKDSCGVGFIADMKNRKSHAIVAQGLQILHNLDHRGAVGADPKLGDGCGILTQIPHAFFRAECEGLGITLPEASVMISPTLLFVPGSTVLRMATM